MWCISYRYRVRTRSRRSLFLRNAKTFVKCIWYWKGAPKNLKYLLNECRGQSQYMYKNVWTLRQPFKILRGLWPFAIFIGKAEWTTIIATQTFVIKKPRRFQFTTTFKPILCIFCIAAQNYQLSIYIDVKESHLSSSIFRVLSF